MTECINLWDTGFRQRYIGVKKRIAQLSSFPPQLNMCKESASLENRTAERKKLALMEEEY